METIPKADCQPIGFIRKMHGVHGDLVLEFQPEFEESVHDAQRFFLEIDGLLVPFFLKEDGFRFKSTKTAIVSFDWVENEKYARRLVGCAVFLFKNEILDKKKESTSSQFIHYLLFEEKSGEIGEITAVNDYSGNVVFEVRYKGNEILIPFNEDFLILANHDKKEIVMRLPDGLIDL